MAQLIIKDEVRLKKGEEGVQKFILFESDGKTRRNGTGKTYAFAMWKDGDTELKGSAALTATSAVNGEYDMVVAATMTDTVEDYDGEIIEDPSGSKLRSNTFKVFVDKSSDGLT